jgi:hypothetical protein
VISQTAISPSDIFRAGRCRLVKKRKQKLPASVVLTAMLVLVFCPTPLAHAIDFGGRTYVDYYGNIDETTFYEHERIRVSISPEVSGRPFPWLFLKASGVFYTNLIGEPRFIDPENILREAYAGLTFGPLDIFIGQKFVNWGKVDVLSPLNVINHTDTSVLSMDNTFEANMADILVQAKMYVNESFDIELIYVPFFKPDYFAIDEITIEEDLLLSYPGVDSRRFNVNAVFENMDIPLFSEWAHSFHAALSYTTFDFDAILAYSYYRDQYLDFDLSGIKEEINDDGPVTEHVITGTGRPAFYRVHNIGAGVSFYLGDFLINSDIAYKVTPDINGTDMSIRNGELFWGVQVEYLFSVIEQPFRLMANGFYRQVMNANAEIVSDYSDVLAAFLNAVLDDYTSQRPPFQVYALLHLDTNFFHETLNVGGNFIYGYSEDVYTMDPAFFISPRIAYKISDYVSTFLGADFWWGGTHEGFLGRDAGKDNFFVRIQVQL